MKICILLAHYFEVKSDTLEMFDWSKDLIEFVVCIWLMICIWLKKNWSNGFTFLQVEWYEEHYQEALLRLSLAVQLDPTYTEFSSRLGECSEFLTKLFSLVKRKGQISSRRLQTMLGSINDSHLGPYRLVHYYFFLLYFCILFIFVYYLFLVH